MFSLSRPPRPHHHHHQHTNARAPRSYLDSKEYNWRGISDVPTVKGKALRVLAQFTPASWEQYRWEFFSNPKRFVTVFALLAGTMLVELDAFFLKDIFWLPPSSVVNIYRLAVWWAVGMVGVRELYAFTTDPEAKRLGSTCWIMMSMMLTEFVVVIK